MALTGDEWQSILGSIAILVGVTVYSNLAGRAPARRTAGPQVVAANTQPVLGRFVHQHGAVVGEAVAVEGGKVLLRQGATHKAVPAAKLERSGDDLRLVGDVDWAEAGKEGAAWAARLGDGPR